MLVLYVTFLFVYVYNARCEKVPCPKVLAVNITDGTRSDNSIIKDGVIFDQQNYFVTNNTIFGCICNIIPCIRKCCRSQEIMINRRCAPRNSTLSSLAIYNGTLATNITPYYEHFYLIYSKKCKPRRKMLLRPHLDTSNKFYVQENGTLFLPRYAGKYYKPDEYCVEVFDVQQYEMKDVVSVILCLREDDFVKPGHHRLLCTGMFCMQKRIANKTTHWFKI
ncbi:hypothetical protein Zmor_007042 [Zophobas morio]|uniref:Methuselah N-terminal domain-containing protein n=1 Tax=Zophobas morio TaxID=2755281 RepID=A0AA38MNZ1_9CUCU|nr:hypothetical protein Zmor_007042 [Zophobas morio]